MVQLKAKLKGKKRLMSQLKDSKMDTENSYKGFQSTHIGKGQSFTNSIDSTTNLIGNALKDKPQNDHSNVWAPYGPSKWTQNCRIIPLNQQHQIQIFIIYCLG